MKGNERQALLIVRELKLANKEAIRRKMAVSSAYVERLCDSLVEDGFLLKTAEATYQLAAKSAVILEPWKGRMKGTPLRGMGGIAVSIYP